MSVLKGFLQPSPTLQTKDVVISERFKGEDGKVLPFKIKVIDQDENDRLINSSMSTKRQKNGQVTKELNSTLYSRRLVLACVVTPDLRDSELCEYYKCIDPLDVPGKMLSSGEYSTLIDAINELNGFNDEEVVEEEAKNS